MQVDTGRIWDLNSEQGKAAKKLLGDLLIPMKVPPTPVQMLRRPPKVGRNEPCPCGSGLKFKHCHWTGRATVVA